MRYSLVKFFLTSHMFVGLLVADGLDLRDGMTRLEHLHRVPRKWRFSAEPNPALQFRLHIALHQQNLAQFEETLLNISTPGNVLYGKHMSRQAVKAMLRPKEEAISGVREWLKSGGITDIDEDSDWMHASVTVMQAENLLNTKYSLYRNKATGKLRMRTLNYAVPTSLRQHIDVILPTTMFEQFHTEILSARPLPTGLHAMKSAISTRKTDFNFAACNTTNTENYVPGDPIATPECIRLLYDMGDPQNASNFPNLASSKLGIAGYINQFAKYADLALFLQLYAPYAVGTNFSVVSVRDGQNIQDDTVDDDSEANLDIQYGLSLSYPVPVTFYTVGNTSDVTDAFDFDFLNYLMSLADGGLPQTLSTSYGIDEQYVPLSYAQAECNLVAQLSARGVSVLYASGDSGVGVDCEVCSNDDCSLTTPRFVPQFPATCPFVTSVGATYGVFPEQAAFFSSGGFSDLFSRPAYQNDAVNAYLYTLGNQWSGLFNASGRGFPDVSAQGNWDVIIDAGQNLVVGGTSVSCPVFSAVIALLNAHRLDNGQPSLGFLNPWLYGAGKSGLNDIILGGSNGCTANDTGTAPEDPDPVIPFASWNATVGWDPVTGLGTPDYQKLLQLSLPPKQDY